MRMFPAKSKGNSGARSPPWARSTSWVACAGGCCARCLPFAFGGGLLPGRCGAGGVPSCNITCSSFARASASGLTNTIAAAIVFVPLPSLARPKGEQGIVPAPGRPLSANHLKDRPWPGGQAQDSPPRLRSPVRLYHGLGAELEAGEGQASARPRPD